MMSPVSVWDSPGAGKRGACVLAPPTRARAARVPFTPHGINSTRDEKTREFPGEDVMQGTTPGARRRGRPRTAWVKCKGSPHSITERRVPELIPVLGSQPAGDVSHKPDDRLPLLSVRPAVTLATLKKAVTNSAAW